MITRKKSLVLIVVAGGISYQVREESYFIDLISNIPLQDAVFRLGTSLRKDQTFHMDRKPELD